MKRFSCDCAGTHFIGDRCDIGVLTTPSYPQLTVGETSDELFITGNPDDILELRPVTDTDVLEFFPPKLVIYPSSGIVKFTITAKRPGLFKIRYEMVGIDAYSFQQPIVERIYAYHKISATDSVDVSTNFHEGL